MVAREQDDFSSEDFMHDKRVGEMLREIAKMLPDAIWAKFAKKELLSRLARQGDKIIVVCGKRAEGREIPLEELFESFKKAYARNQKHGMKLSGRFFLDEVVGEGAKGSGSLFKEGGPLPNLDDYDRKRSHLSRGSLGKWPRDDE